MTGLLKGALVVFIASQGLLACTDRALVYGERTGLNLAIRADPAQGSPLEVNTGFQRRVVGFVPPSGYTDGGRPSGEAVNMFSRFDLERAGRTDGNFDDRIAISTSFASGQAALNIAGNERVVAQIVRNPSFTLSSNPDDVTIRQRLLAFVNASPANLQAYLQQATSAGLAMPATGSDRTRVAIALGNPANAGANRTIAGSLNLI